MQVLTDLKTKQDFQDVQDLAGFCFAAWSIDMQVLTDLKTRFPNPENPAQNPENLENPENPANLENPAHILLISWKSCSYPAHILKILQILKILLKILLFNLTKR